MKEQLQQFCELFFEKLLIQVNSISIKEDNKGRYLIHINSDDSKLIIGEQGNTINMIQRIIGISANNFWEENIKIRLEINDYFKTKDQELFDFIEKKILLILENGWDYMLPQYSAYERKKIHSFVAKKHPEIITKSRGEWNNRRLFLLRNTKIKKTKSKLTIDIDWNNI